MLPTPFGLTQNPQSQRLDDPAVYAQNARGQLTDAQRTLLNPFMVFFRSLPPWTIASLPLFLAGGLPPALADILGVTLPAWVPIAAPFVLAGTVLVPAILIARARTEAAGLELRMSFPQVTEGTITFQRGTYQARSADGTALMPIIPGKLALSPGWYRMAILPRSRILLSVESAVGEQQHDAALNELIRSLLHLTPDVLQMNQRGEATAAQASSTAGGAYVIAGILSVLTLVASPHVVQQLFPWLGWYTVLGTAGLVLLYFVGARAFIRTVVRGGVTSIDGTIRITIQTSKNSRSATLHVADTRMSLPIQLADALPQNGRYRVYVFKKYGGFANIEAIEDASATPQSPHEDA